MIAIKEVEENYHVDPIDAVIDGNTIIPGLYGKTIDIDGSYTRMRKEGFYNESLLIYKDIKNKVSLDDNLTKYVISGNVKKNQVSLIFLVDEYDKVNKVVNILDKYGIKGNFFVDGFWFEKNSNTVINLIDSNHIVGNLSYNMDYQNSSFTWMDTIIKKVGKQKQGYCLRTNNEKDLKICALNKDYTISPSIKVSKNLLTETKNNLHSGSIIAIEINDATMKELELAIKYINSKNLSITNLQEHLKEF